MIALSAMTLNELVAEQNSILKQALIRLDLDQVTNQATVCHHIP
jgi:hypothetical protein